MTTKTAFAESDLNLIREFFDVQRAMSDAGDRLNAILNPQYGFERGWRGINWAYQMFSPGPPTTATGAEERAAATLAAAGLTADEARDLSARYDRLFQQVGDVVGRYYPRIRSDVFYILTGHIANWPSGSFPFAGEPDVVAAVAELRAALTASNRPTTTKE